MNSIHQLVREALAGHREERSGCFVHNAAAVELLEHGLEAMAAIESEVLACPVHDYPAVPGDLASVMVIYSRLVRRLDAADRCVAFVRQLPQQLRLSTLGCVCSAWRVKDPDIDDLPESLRRYIESILTGGIEAE